MSQVPGLFVVATDTGVGKTRVTTALIRLIQEQGRRVGAFKPVATGADIEHGDRLGEDGQALTAALTAESLAPPPDRVVPMLFGPPLAPPAAARLSGRTLLYADLLKLTFDTWHYWSGRVDLIVLEGIGGLHCPIAEDATLVRLAADLDLPLLIVARSGLGTLNHTLCTVEVAQRRGLRIAGLILNQAEPTSTTIDDPSVATNRHELARLLPGIGILGELDYNTNSQATVNTLRGYDWAGLARPPRFANGFGP